MYCRIIIFVDFISKSFVVIASPLHRPRHMWEKNVFEINKYKFLENLMAIGSLSWKWTGGKATKGNGMIDLKWK